MAKPPIPKMLSAEPVSNGPGKILPWLIIAGVLIGAIYYFRNDLNRFFTNDNTTQEN